MGLFNKAAVFTDIHFGKFTDSEQHNKDCLDYIDWFCAKVEEHNCDTILFLGDWFHNKTSQRSDTINYSWIAINKLISLGRPIHWIVGNHDLYFKSNRDINSLVYIADKVNFINDLQVIDDVMFCPWLLGNEYIKPTTKKVKYIFGHFEFPGFLVNQMIEMKDTGGLNMNDFTQCSGIFSGHFHKRQLKINKHGIPIYFIGNAFPHDFNDVADKDRGCMILEWDKEPIFENWSDAPTFERTVLSKLLESFENDTFGQLYHKKTIIECVDDMGIDMQQAMEIKDTLSDLVRNLKLKPAQYDIDASQEVQNIKNAQTINEMVIEHLSLLDLDGTDYSNELFVQLYENAEK